MLIASNLGVKYRNGVEAVKDVDLTLEEGKIYGVLGPSGGGKSSFLKGMLQLVSNSGKVRFRNKPIGDFAKSTAYVEQKENIDRDFPITALQCVLLGTYPALGLFKRPGQKEKEAALQALEEVGLGELKNRQIGELSGGQFQRVLIARAMVQDATLIFLDEPFVGIDVQNEADLITHLKNLAARGKTIFIVHHDLSKVKSYFDEVILINGEVVAAGPLDEAYTQENIAKTFNFRQNPADYSPELTKVGNY